MRGEPEELDVLQDELEVVLTAWKLKPGMWRIAGRLPASLGAEQRPIVDVAGMRYVVHRQASDLTENDTLFRHAFMRHLANDGLPVPPLLERPDGSTYAVVEEGIYELQGFLDGQPYFSDGPGNEARLAAAARTMGALHQSSASFEWRAHAWPEDRSAIGLAATYADVIKQAALRDGTPASVADGLRRVASTSAARAEAAHESLSGRRPGPPELHIHGDYQPHNLAFGQECVSAMYDFAAARWSRRIDEVAYGLLYFAGVRWDDASGLTPPLVDDGLDILRVHRFLSAYATDAPPAEGEAELLGDAIALAFPIVFANGAAEDLIFPQDFAEPIDENSALQRLHWADSFWLWLDRYRDTLAEAWSAQE